MCDCDSTKQETLVEVLLRHRREERELEGCVRSFLKQASKKDKAAMEAKGVQMKFDLKAKHRQETERFDEESTGLIETNSEDTAENRLYNTVRSSTEAKKMKAAKKKERIKNKSLARDKIKAEIASNAGPSLREHELTAINGHLAKDSLVVKEIIADGNCLFRALADQLEFVGATVEGDDKEGDAEKNFTFVDLRFMAADHLRSHADEFAPFLGVEPISQQFEGYCNNMESDGEWGGQIELRALSASLRRQIHIYDMSTPLIIMGEDYFGNAPLKITYHRHYFTLGEHYNSVRSLDDSS